MTIKVKIVADCKDSASCAILRGKMQQDGLVTHKVSDKNYPLDPFLGDHYGEGEFLNEKEAQKYAKKFIKNNPSLMHQVTYL